MRGVGVPYAATIQSARSDAWPSVVQRISPADADAATGQGWLVVDPGTVMATHLNQALISNASDLLGPDEVQALLDGLRERAAQLADQAQRERDAREKENTLRTQIDKNRKASDEKLRTLAAARDRDLEQLRNRPARPPEPVAGGAVPANPGADKPPEFGCTGAGLAGPDAAFLVRETATAIELKEHLRACYAHVDKLELELNGPPDRPKP